MQGSSEDTECCRCGGVERVKIRGKPLQFDCAQFESKLHIYALDTFTLKLHPGVPQIFAFKLT